MSLAGFWGMGEGRSMVLHVLQHAGQQAGRCRLSCIFLLPNVVPPADLHPMAHRLSQNKRRGERGKIMFSLLAARWRQHLPLPTPDSAKLSFHHLIAHTASPRRHTKINAHRSLSQEFINSFKGQGLIFHFL